MQCSLVCTVVVGRPLSRHWSSFREQLASEEQHAVSTMRNWKRLVCSISYLIIILIKIIMIDLLNSLYLSVFLLCPISPGNTSLVSVVYRAW